MNSETKSENLIIGQVAHDLKGIIAKINCVNEILRNKLNNTISKDAEELLFFIDMLCEQGNQITNDLLDTCELDSFDNISKENCSLNQLIDQQGRIYKLLADKKQITFHTIIPDKELYCELDRFKFIRVLDNLFSNALKFTQHNGEIKISINEIDGKAMIAINDTGIGIPTLLQKEIFKKYTKAKRYGTQNEKFTGLGLYIVKKIIDLHKGQIWFESEEGKGTTFYIALDYTTK